MDKVILYFNHCYPPDRGYAYVGASRVRAAVDLYHFGLIRQSDWLPVGGDETIEHTTRGVDSLSDSDDRSADEDSSSGSEGDDDDTIPSDEVSFESFFRFLQLIALF